MKKLIKWGLIAFVVLIVIGVIAGGDSDTSTPPASEESSSESTTVEPVEVVTTEFIADFDKNQLAAEEKYAGKIIQFTAFVDNISEDILGNPFLSLKPVNDEYYFDTSIQCIFDDASMLTSLENGQSVTVQGEFESQSLGIIGLKKCELQ